MTVGASSADVTPSHRCELGGYTDSRVWTRIEDRLEVSVVCFDDGDRRLFLVSLDTLYIGREILLFLKEAIAAHDDGRPADVVTFASHTHFAPMIDRDKPLLGRVDERYVELLKAALVDAVRQSVSQHDCARVRSYQSQTDFSVNRRLVADNRTIRNGLRRRRRVYLAPNPDGYVDRRLRIRLLQTANGAPVAALVHFACHPTSYPDRTAITADYVGTIRRAIRKSVGAAIPVIFMQGCGGDVRASVEGSVTIGTTLQTLVHGPHFVTASLQDWETWRSAIARHVELLLSGEAPSNPLQGRIAFRRGTVPITALRRDAAEGNALELLYADIGDDMRLLAMNAEPLADWTECFPGDVHMSGCCGNVFGYLPREQDVALGGYEVDGHQHLFDALGTSWTSGFEERVASAAARLLRDEAVG